MKWACLAGNSVEGSRLDDELGWKAFSDSQVCGKRMQKVVFLFRIHLPPQVK